MGETVDSNGRRSFVTTLRAREQDIRREKATSNVCTNQTLMAVTAAIQLGWLGTQGLREIATRCAQGAHYLFDELVKIDGVAAVSTQPFFREFAVRLGRDASAVLLTMASDGVLGGVAVAALTCGEDPSIEGDVDDVLLVTVTERRTQGRDRPLRRGAAKGGRTVTPRALSGGRAASAPLLGHETEPTIFEMSVPGRSAYQLRTTGVPATALAVLIPQAHLNSDVIDVAEVSERDLVAHFTRLSHRQFSVDLGMYPLGSCTMKYNPKFCDAVANDPGLNSVHPGAPAELTQGWLEILATLEEKLCADHRHDRGDVATCRRSRR